MAEYTKIKTQTESVDPLTGEILITNTEQVIKCKSKEEFCMIFVQALPIVSKLTQAESNILVFMMLKADFYAEGEIGNRISYTNTFKAMLVKETGLSLETIKKAVTKLINKSLLLKAKNDRQTFYLNPKYFFQGNLGDRTKAISITTKYLLE